MTDRSRILLAIPVFNEAKSIDRVLSEVRPFARDVLVIDDGSTDGTPLELARHRVEVVRHAENRGYGRSMQDILRWARFDGYDWVITMDCDEQHEPASIPSFVRAIEEDDADVISGSRYLHDLPGDDLPPPERRNINAVITREINERLDLGITDAFCGFKAYRIGRCAPIPLDVDGYDFPMQFWVQAAALRLRLREIPVRLIYNDPNRSFGGPLDDPARRLATYRCTLHRELWRCRARLPARAIEGLACR